MNQHSGSGERNTVIDTWKIQHLPHKHLVISHHKQFKLSCRTQMQNTSHELHISAQTIYILSFTANQKELNRETKEGERKESNLWYKPLHPIPNKATEVLTTGNVYPCSSKPTSQKECICQSVCAYSMCVCLKKFWMCACACSTKALVSCNSAEPRLQTQVTLLYWGFPAGKELCVSRVWGKPQRPNGRVLSGKIN